MIVLLLFLNGLGNTEDNYIKENNDVPINFESNNMVNSTSNQKQETSNQTQDNNIINMLNLITTLAIITLVLSVIYMVFGKIVED